MIIETMLRLGIRHQSELYALPLADQFIEHTMNQFSGAYDPPRKAR